MVDFVDQEIEAWKGRKRNREDLFEKVSNVEKRSARRRERKAASSRESTQVPIEKKSVSEPEAAEKEEWWVKPIETYLSSGGEIENKGLDQRFKNYIEEVYNAKDLPALTHAFEEFGGRPAYGLMTEEQHQKDFSDLVMNNFRSWLTSKPPLLEHQEEKKTSKQVDISIDWKKAMTELSLSTRYELQKFVEIWGSGQAMEVTLGIEKGDLTYIGVYREGGASASVSVETLIKYSGGVLEDFRNAKTGHKGIRFKDTGNYLDSGSGFSISKGILSNVAIDGRKLINKNIPGSDFMVHFQGPLKLLTPEAIVELKEEIKQREIKRRELKQRELKKKLVSET